MARGLYAEVHHDETRFVSEGGGAKRAVGGNHNGKHTLKRGGIQHLRTFCVATVDFREGLHSISRDSTSTLLLAFHASSCSTLLPYAHSWLELEQRGITFI